MSSFISSGRFLAVLDANVLYSVPLTDLFVRLAMAGLYRAVWSDDIHAEWHAALLKNRPDLDRKRVQRRLAAMQRALPDATISGYAALIDGLELPDPAVSWKRWLGHRCASRPMICAKLAAAVFGSLRWYRMERLGPLCVPGFWAERCLGRRC